MELRARARGWSVRAAAREVGVYRSAAANWTKGYKTYRNGVEVGFVPPLDPLEVRWICGARVSSTATLLTSVLSIRREVFR